MKLDEIHASIPQVLEAPEWMKEPIAETKGTPPAEEDRLLAEISQMGIEAGEATE
ncbi:hypothetical protein ACLOJK_007834 [Asimina triloba]